LTPGLTEGKDSVLEWEGVLKQYLLKEAHSALRSKVFEKDLLEGTLIGNLQRTFVMPIYRELSNMHLLP
jgi:hypothetical protein